MSLPPPGYDDESVVPQQRMKFLLGQFEDELATIGRVFQQNLPGRFQAPETQLEHEFQLLRDSAEELGSDYPFLVERLIADYEHFKTDPSEQRLERLSSDVKSLQLLLVG